MKADEKKCPQCAEAVKKDARVCRHCGHQFNQEENDAAAAKRNTRDTLLGCGAVLLIGAVGLGMCSFSGGDGDPAAAAGDFEKVRQSILEAAGPCDTANSTVVQVLDEAAGDDYQDMTKAYAAAKRAQAACETSWMDIGKLQVPQSLPSEARAKAQKLLDVCSNAYFTRKNSLEAMMKAIDGDTRPSIVTGVTDNAKLAGNLVIVCVAQMEQIAQSLKASPKTD